MKKWLSKLSMKIGRMGRWRYFLSIMGVSGFSLAIFFSSFIVYLYSFGTLINVINFLLVLSKISFLLLSTFFLAKRLQDCGISGLWAIVMIVSHILSGVYITIIYIVFLFIMCFIKGDSGKNKYGKPE